MRTQVLVVGAGPGRPDGGDGSGVARHRCRRRRDPPRRRSAQRQVQSRLGALDGDLPPARRRGKAARRRLARGLPERLRLSHHGDRHRAVPHRDSRPRARRYSATGGPDTWWPTPEPPHRINQVYLEPILFSHAAAQPRITILARTEIVGDRAGRTRGGGARAQSRQRQTHSASQRRFVDRMRRQPLAGAQVDRRELVGHAGDPARAVDLYRGAATRRR